MLNVYIRRKGTPDRAYKVHCTFHAAKSEQYATWRSNFGRWLGLKMYGIIIAITGVHKLLHLNYTRHLYRCLALAPGNDSGGYVGQPACLRL